MAVSAINVEQQGMGEANGRDVVDPNEPVTVDVNISGIGIIASSGGTAIVSLHAGNLIYTKQVNVDSLNSENTINVPFQIIYSPDDIGIQTLTATITPDGSFEDNNNLNNVKSKDIEVQCDVAHKGTQVPFYYQADPNWADHVYDDQSPKTMQALGCVTSSAAMVLGSYGLDTDANGKTITAGDLNDLLKNWGLESFSNYKYRGYTRAGGVVWGAVVAIGRQSATNSCLANGGALNQCVTEANSKISYKGRTAFNKTSVNKAICSGKPVMLVVPSHAGGGRTHTVLATATVYNSRKGEETYSIHDPGGRVTNTPIDLDNSYFDPTEARFLEPLADPSMFFAYGSANIDYVITDPLGRRTGYNPLTQESFSEIPGATYNVESIGSDDPNDPQDTGTPFEKEFENVQSALDGTYTVDMYSVSGGSYTLDFNSYDANGNFNDQQSYEGAISANGSTQIQFVHNAETLPAVNAKLVLRHSLLRQDIFHRRYSFSAGGTIRPKIGKFNGTDLHASVEILVGGVTGFKQVIPKARFHRLGFGKHQIWMYHSPDHQISLQLKANGQFEIHGQNLNLAGVPKEQRNQLILKIDDLAGTAQMYEPKIKRKHGFEQWLRDLLQQSLPKALRGHQNERKKHDGYGRHDKHQQGGRR